MHMPAHRSVHDEKLLNGGVGKVGDTQFSAENIGSPRFVNRETHYRHDVYTSRNVLQARQADGLLNHFWQMPDLGYDVVYHKIH